MPSSTSKQTSLERILQSQGFGTRKACRRLIHRGDVQVEGVLVTEVKPNSAAALANLREGMLIQEVNRKPVKNVEEFNAALEESANDRSVLLRVRVDDVSSYIAVKINR